MSSSTKLTALEAKLFLREPMALLFGVLLPVVILLVLGYLFPGFDEPAAELDGLRYIDVFTPTIMCLALATLGLTVLPSTLTSYRQMGILRRLRITPVHPAQLLGAQMAVYTAMGMVSSLLVGAAAMLAFDVPFPDSFVWFVVALVLAATSMLAIGLLVAALARTPSAAQIIGFSLFFPMLFFAGLWIPRPVMPDALLTISDLTPLGAAVEAMDDAWTGTTPSALLLAVMVIYTVVCGAIAIRVFRWE